MSASGKAEPIDPGASIHVLEEATKTLYELSGDQLLAFVVRQKVTDGGPGWYMAVIPNAGIARSSEATLAFMQDLHEGIGLIIERLSQ